MVSRAWRPALLLAIAACAQGLSLKAPLSMRCDGSDFSGKEHSRYAFSLPHDKAEYRLTWAVDVEFDNAEEESKLQGKLSQTGFKVTIGEEHGSALWESGLVRSEALMFKLSRNTMGAAFDKLQAAKTYRWSLSWALDGSLFDSETPVYSQEASATFHLAPAPSDWNVTHWIGSNTTNLYMGTFNTPANLQSSVLYVCGLGFSTVMINDKPLSSPEPMLTVGPWTPNNFINKFSTYDVTSLLAPSGSPNNVTVLLGVGWRRFKRSDPENAMGDYTERVFRMMLTGTVGGAASNLLVSDAASMKWKATASRITMDDIYNGETHDSRVVLNWTTVSTNIIAAEGPRGFMTPWIGPYVTMDREVQPVAITEPQKGIFVVDFGVNLAGVVRMNNVARFASMVPAGQNITLRHGEILQHLGLGIEPQTGMIYTGNLRSALATDTYIFGSTNDEKVWRPKLTYHGFRYLEVSGWGSSAAGMAANFSVELSDFTLLHFHTNVKQTAHVSFSNALLTGMQRCAVGAQRSNLQTTVTDCDQRDERLGWMGDLGLSSQSITINFDVHSHFEHVVQTIDTEIINGTLPDVVPFERFGGRPADVSWAIAYFSTIYETWKMYKDTSIVSRYLNSLVVAQMTIAENANNDGICNIGTPYGDWCPPPTIAGNDNTRMVAGGPFVSLTSYIMLTKYTGEMAAAVGNTTIATSMASQVEVLKNQYVACFWNVTSKTFDKDVESDYALAGAIDTLFGGLPDNADVTIKANLASHLQSSMNHSLSGITGLRFLLDYLDAADMSGFAHDIMLQESYPSIGYMLTNSMEPATENLWEIQDAFAEGGGMNSRNHHMFSSFSSYLVRKMAGMDFRDRKLHAPRLDSSARFHGATSKFESPHGVVSFAWEYVGGIQRFSKYPTIESASSVLLTCGAATFGKSGGVIEKVVSASLLSHGEEVAAANASVSASCVGKESCEWSLASLAATISARTVTEVRVEVKCSQPLSAMLRTSVPIGVAMSLELPARHTASSVSNPSATFTGSHALPSGTTTFEVRL
ncbi:Beta-galactosidase 15 [Diplonema papillatum]|nr:Beta-galactosidase 15 [Diplonema papillatum]